MTPVEKLAVLRWKVQAKRRAAWEELQAQSPETARFLKAVRETFGPINLQWIALNGRRLWGHDTTARQANLPGLPAAKTSERVRGRE